MSELPNDPMILLSYVNTALRDRFSSLDAFCACYGADRKLLEQKLSLIDYQYDADTNRFV